MNQEKKLSVIIPVYNVRDYVERCVQSVTAQDYANLEIVLVDDGSDDGSAELCDRLQKADARVSVFHKSHEGVAVARKFGLAKSHGEYIHFLDSDDWLEHDAYSACLNGGGYFDVCVFGFRRITPENEILVENIPAADCSKKELIYNQSALSFLLWNKIFSRPLLERIDFSAVDGITFSEDSYVSYTALLLAENVVFVSRALYFWFLRKNSVTKNMTIKNQMDQIYSFSLILDFCIKNNFDTSMPILQEKLLNSKTSLIEPDYTVSEQTLLERYKKFNSLFPKVKLSYGNDKTRLFKIYAFIISCRLYKIALYMFRVMKRRHERRS